MVENVFHDVGIDLRPTFFSVTTAKNGKNHLCRKDRAILSIYSRKKGLLRSPFFREYMASLRSAFLTSTSRSASKSFIYSSSSRNPYLLARARTSSCPRLLSGLGTTSGQPRKTASGSLNRVKKGDLVKKIWILVRNLGF